MKKMEAVVDRFLQNKSVINVGLRLFKDSFDVQNVSCKHVDFYPPCRGDITKVNMLSELVDWRIEEANKEAVKRIWDSEPFLVGIERAGDVIPEMDKYTLLHAGPPIEFEKMCGPMKGAIIGALIYEGLANDENEALKIVKKIKFEPCHHRNSAGPMAGIISYSMYVFVVKNEKFGNFGYSNMNEGLGKILRFGAYSSDVIKRLKWMENVLGPTLKEVLKAYIRKNKHGINVKHLASQALNMGDECHNRNVTATNLFLKEILPYLLEIDCQSKMKKEVVNFISNNPHFFLNLSMAACKATADAVIGLKNSTIVSAMARNGIEFGIRVAGLGNKWFTAKCDIPKGLYFSGFSEKDANPDLGDSTISETVGLGAFAMACAPAIVKFVGGNVEDAFMCVKKMYDITYSEHNAFLIPNFNFRGTPLGIDIRKVVETGITPYINTGIAHKNAGVGQIGAGITFAPYECFEKAFNEFHKNFLTNPTG